MNKKSILFFLLLLCLAMVAHALFDSRRENQDGMAKMETKSGKGNTSIAPVANGNPNAKLTASSMNGALETSSLSNRLATTHPERKELSSEEINKEVRATLSWMMKDRKKELKETYNDLFKRLNLPSDKLSILKDLIVEYEFSPKIIGLDFPDSGVLPQDEVVKRLTEYRDGVKANLQDLLDDADYSYTVHYLETLPVRGEARIINEYFEGKTDTMNQEQMDAFVDMLYSLRNTMISMVATGADNKSIETYMKQTPINNAAGILTPSQISVLKDFYNKPKPPDSF